MPPPATPVISTASSWACISAIFSCIACACFISWPRFFMARPLPVGLRRPGRAPSAAPAWRAKLAHRLDRRAGKGLQHRLHQRMLAPTSFRSSRSRALRLLAQGRLALGLGDGDEPARAGPFAEQLAEPVGEVARRAGGGAKLDPPGLEMRRGDSATADASAAPPRAACRTAPRPRQSSAAAVRDGTRRRWLARARVVGAAVRRGVRGDRAGAALGAGRSAPARRRRHRDPAPPGPRAPARLARARPAPAGRRHRRAAPAPSPPPGSARARSAPRPGPSAASARRAPAPASPASRRAGGRARGRLRRSDRRSPASGASFSRVRKWPSSSRSCKTISGSAPP